MLAGGAVPVAAKERRDMRNVLKRLSFASVFALAVATALPAAGADLARVGFGEYDITCEVDIWAVNDTMARRGITAYDLSNVGVEGFVLTVELGAITPDELVEKLQHMGFEAFLLGAAGTTQGPI